MHIPCETRSIDGGAQGGFGIGGPFSAITVGDFPLDDAGSEGAPADIIGGIDPAREIAKGEYFVARAADLAGLAQHPYANSSPSRAARPCVVAGSKTTASPRISTSR